MLLGKWLGLERGMWRPWWDPGWWRPKGLGDPRGLGWSWTDSSFSMRSARAFRVTSKGSKPKSSSCCCLVEEPKPKAACQSVEEETGIVSEESKGGRVSKWLATLVK